MAITVLTYLSRNEWRTASWTVSQQPATVARTEERPSTDLQRPQEPPLPTCYDERPYVSRSIEKRKTFSGRTEIDLQNRWSYDQPARHVHPMLSDIIESRQMCPAKLETRVHASRGTSRRLC
jgi:hypothetical protein